MIIRQNYEKHVEVWKATDVSISENDVNGRTYIEIVGVNNQSEGARMNKKTISYETYEEAEKRFEAILHFMQDNVIIERDEFKGAIDKYVERRENGEAYPK